MSRFKVAQTVYMIASNRIVQPVVVKKIDDDMYLVGFERSGETWVPEDRLYARKEEAERSLEAVTFEQPKVITYIDKVRR